MEMQTIKARITFFEELLGTCSGNKELHREFIASKAPAAESMEEEVAAIGVDGMMEKSMTVFPRDENGQPFLYDYQIKGFFKDSCGVLRKVPGTKASKIKAYKKEIDGLLFVSPRKIPLNLNGGEIGVCERPLRASTAQRIPHMPGVQRHRLLGHGGLQLIHALKGQIDRLSRAAQLLRHTAGIDG